MTCQFDKASMMITASMTALVNHLDVIHLSQRSRRLALAHITFHVTICKTNTNIVMASQQQHNRGHANKALTLRHRPQHAALTRKRNHNSS